MSGEPMFSRHALTPLGMHSPSIPPGGDHRAAPDLPTQRALAMMQLARAVSGLLIPERPGDL